MNKSMKSVLTIALVGTVTIGIASVVLAKGGFGPGQGWGGHHTMMGQGMGHGPQGMMGRGMGFGPQGMMGRGMGFGPRGMMQGAGINYSDEELNEIKSKIGITSEQESAWNDYVNAIKSRATLMQAHQEIRANNSQTFFKEHETFQKQGLAQMQQVSSATSALTEILTPEQQKLAGNLIKNNSCL